MTDFRPWKKSWCSIAFTVCRICGGVETHTVVVYSDVVCASSCLPCLQAFLTSQELLDALSPEAKERIIAAIGLTDEVC